MRSSLWWNFRGRRKRTASKGRCTVHRVHNDPLRNCDLYTQPDLIPGQRGCAPPHCQRICFARQTTKSENQTQSDRSVSSSLRAGAFGAPPQTAAKSDTECAHGARGHRKRWQSEIRPRPTAPRRLARGPLSNPPRRTRRGSCFSPSGQWPLTRPVKERRRAAPQAPRREAAADGRFGEPLPCRGAASNPPLCRPKKAKRPPAGVAVLLFSGGEGDSHYLNITLPQLESALFRLPSAPIRAPFDP